MVIFGLVFLQHVVYCKALLFVHSFVDYELASRKSTKFIERQAFCNKST